MTGDVDFSTLQYGVRKEKSLYKFHLTYLRYIFMTSESVSYTVSGSSGVCRWKIQ